MVPTTRHDVVVIGGGVAGVVCAATLASQGIDALLIAETKSLGHNVRSVMLEGHRCIVQHPLWHFAWGGGNWAQVVREQNLATRVHVNPHPEMTIRGLWNREKLPILMSAKSTCDALFRLLPGEVDAESRVEVERIMHAGLMTEYRALFQMHDVSLNAWLAGLNASDLAAAVVKQLASALAGLPASSIGDTFSVFGTFVHIRAFLSGEGLPVFIEPDTQQGLIEPLAERTVEHGGTVWTGTRVGRLLTTDGRVSGVEMADGRTVVTDYVALAVGNPRLAGLFAETPPELLPILAKEGALATTDLSVINLLQDDVPNLSTYLMITDPSSGVNAWIAPVSNMAPWNSPDDRRLYLVWGSGGADSNGEPLDEDGLQAVLTEMCDEAFPGYTESIVATKTISHRHHWMNPCYTGPKVPRKSSNLSGLWYVGEGTVPVAGIGMEQAAYAGRDGAVSILNALGKEFAAPSFAPAAS